MTVRQMEAIASTSGKNVGAKPRIVWVDIARGMAICLVVLHHSVVAVRQVGEIGETASLANGLVKDMRMPLFFFCSGLLASWGIAKPWTTVLMNQGLVLVWLILLWTVLHAALQQIIPVNPWAPPPDPRFLFITPYMNLWFIYAILLLTLLMRALTARRIVTQIVVILALNVPFVLAYRTFEDSLINSPAGLKLLVDNLATYAILYFAAGCWFAPIILALFRTKRRIIVLFPLAVLVWCAELARADIPAIDFHLPRIIAGIPDVFLGLATAALLSLWGPTRVIFAWLGTRTLEIFLFHSVLVGLAFMLIEPLGITSAGAALLLLFGFGLVGSIAAEQVTRLARLNFLFRPPERVREYARSLLATKWPRRVGPQHL